MAMLFWGIVFLAAGGGGLFFVGRRKFYIRNEAGLEEYNSYTSALANSVVNKIISVAAVLAIFMGISFIGFGLFAPK